MHVGGILLQYLPAFKILGNSNLRFIHDRSVRRDMSTISSHIKRVIGFPLAPTHCAKSGTGDT